MQRIERMMENREARKRRVCFWGGVILAVLWLFTYPLYASAFDVTNVAAYLINIPMTLGVCLLWGYGGILSFGEVAFFGVGGYVYGIVSGNLLDNAMGGIVAVVVALAAAGIFSLAFGYFVFYARVEAWIVPILTFVLTLVLYTFMSQTAGADWHVGSVALGGYNGMTNIESFRIGQYTFGGVPFYYLVCICVLAVFLAVEALSVSRYGRIIVAMREDDVRTEFLGHDVRRRRIEIFLIAALLSALSGILYAQWGNYMVPSTMGLTAATLPIIWVAVGGRTSLPAVAISAFLLNMLSFSLSSGGSQLALIIMGALLIVVMLFFPEGIFVTLGRTSLTARLIEWIPNGLVPQRRVSAHGSESKE